MVTKTDTLGMVRIRFGIRQREAALRELRGHQEIQLDALRIYQLHPDKYGEDDIRLTEEKKAEIAETIPLARLGRADDIAGACVFLASPLSTYCTGITLDVNGGMLIH